MGKGHVLALESLALVTGIPVSGIPAIIYDFWTSQKSVSLENKVNRYIRTTELMTTG